MQLSRLIKNHYFILACIFIFHLVNNFFILSRDNTVLVFDPFNYYECAKEFFSPLHTVDSFRPPFLSLVAWPVFSLFGASPHVIIFWVSSVALLFAMLAVYFFAKEIFSGAVGLLSCFMLSTFPIIFGHSRSFMSDLFLIGWVVLSILFLVKSKGLSSLKFVILLGLSAGLGLLTKITFPIFVIGPFMYFLFGKTRFNKKTSLHLCLLGIIVFFVCAFWYLPNILGAVQEYIHRGHFSFRGEGVNLSNFYMHIFWYPEILFRDCIGWFYLPVILYSLCLLIYWRIKRKAVGWLTLLLIWIILPYIISMGFAIKNPRYIISILPPIAMISSFCVLNSTKLIKKTMFTSLVIILGLGQYFFISYSFAAQKIFPALEALEDKSALLSRECSYQWFGLLAARKQDWKLAELSALLQRLDAQEKAKIVFIQTRPIIYEGLMGRRTNNDPKRLITNSTLCFTEKHEFARPGALSGILSEADIVFFTEDPKGVEMCPNEQELKSLFKNMTGDFILEKEFLLPDGSYLKVYKNKRGKI